MMPLIVLLDLGGLATALLAIIVLLLVIVILSYNGLVSKRNRVQDAWSQIDVQLKRRYDLIPNLIETVKGYAKYEKSVLTEVTKLRASIVTGTADEKLKANDQLTKSLKSIFAVAESYPDLKASANFKELQDQLEGTEDKISYVRTSYNDYVLDYNNALQQFPGNIFASMFGFKPDDYFKVASEAEKQPVKVDFGDMSGDAGAPQKGKGKKGAA